MKSTWEAHRYYTSANEIVIHPRRVYTLYDRTITRGGTWRAKSPPYRSGCILLEGGFLFPIFSSKTACVDVGPRIEGWMTHQNKIRQCRLCGPLSGPDSLSPVAGFAAAVALLGND